MTAVKRVWRGRGIAKSLKLAEIAWAQANGIERLTATNEERNAAMHRVNASLGYRPAPGRVQLRGPATAP
jgi:mycothiol synthase